MARLRAAVQSRLVADVPVGAFLSGGVDSSAVVALMAEARDLRPQSFSIGFDGRFDETCFAGSVAALIQTDHHSRHIGLGDVTLHHDLPAIFDEPFADASALPLLRLCQLAREQVKVALSGDGADELFAGYRRYRFHLAEERLRALVPRRLRTAVFRALGQIFPRADWAPQWLRGKATLEALALEGAEAYARAVGYQAPALRARLFSADFVRALQGHRAEDRYIRLMAEAPADDPVAQAQYADLKIWLPGDILTKLDRTSMSQGLEVREPLLDTGLLAFATRLPASLRIRGRQGKWIMKAALAGHLPPATLYRPKQGFVVPLADWFRGPLAAQVERACASGVLAESGWFSRPFLLEALAAHRAGRADHSRLLWQFLMFDGAWRHLFTRDSAPQQNTGRLAGH
ncbi:MAG: asparagine synthase-related protein [Chakrabartia sp.]